MVEEGKKQRKIKQGIERCRKEGVKKRRKIFRTDLLRYLKTGVGIALMRHEVRDWNYRECSFVDVLALQCKAADINDCFRNVLSSGSKTINEV
jgi:hypothetical protein